MIELAEMVPSVELLRALLDRHGDTVDFEQRLVAVAAWERMLGFCTAAQHDLLADIAGDEDLLAPGWNAGPSARWRAEQVGLALGVTGASAQRPMNTAATLTDALPTVTAALRAGAITVHHARVAAAHATVLDREVARAVDAIVMTDPQWRTPSQLERAFATVVMTVDPAGAAARHEAARRGRRVSVRTEPDGMSALWALLPAEHGQLVHQVIDAYARSGAARNTPGDHRTLDERRADALVDLITRPPTRYHHTDHHTATTKATTDQTADSTGSGSGSGDSNSNTGDTGTGGPGVDSGPGTGGPDGGGPAGPDSSGQGGAGAGGPGGPKTTAGPTLHGHRPQIHITVAWSTLIGLDDTPADLTGYGPTDATTARRIAADPDSTWRRLLVDPATGRLLDYGRDTYHPPQDLIDHVIARDVSCTFPTCDTPAHLTDLDHRTSWDDGGHTNPANLDPLCRHHHRLKHEAGWTHHRHPDTGESTWTDPHGHHHTKPATRLPTPPPVEPPPAVPNDDDLGDPPF